MSAGSRVVYKYAEILSLRDVAMTLTLPVGARILYVESDPAAAGLGLVFWAEVDRDAPTEQRRFTVLGTGHPIPDDVALEHVATVRDGHFVWHVYEVTS